MEKTWLAGLEAQWSWAQEANETQEYSAGLKGRADRGASRTEEQQLNSWGLVTAYADVATATCSTSASHSHIKWSLKKSWLYKCLFPNIIFLKTSPSFALVTLTQLQEGLFIVPPQQLKEMVVATMDRRQGQLIDEGNVTRLPLQPSLKGCGDSAHVWEALSLADCSVAKHPWRRQQKTI